METEQANVEAVKPKTPWWLPWLLVAWIGVTYSFLPGFVFTLIYMSTIIIFREHIRGLLATGIALLLFSILPSWLFWFGFFFVVLCIPSDKMPFGYEKLERRLEIYMTEVALDQSIAQMRQLRLELVSHAIELDYTRMVRKDGSPAYYRKVRANLRKLMLTTVRLRERTPKHLWRGLDYRIMDEINRSVDDVDIKADRKTAAA